MAQEEGFFPAVVKDHFTKAEEDAIVEVHMSSRSLNTSPSSPILMLLSGFALPCGGGACAENG
jgi:hypothetical protein